MRKNSITIKHDIKVKHSFCDNQIYLLAILYMYDGLHSPTEYV